MHNSREVGVGLLTVSVAVAACSIADCAEGVAFSVLTAGGGYLAAMAVFLLVRRSTNPHLWKHRRRRRLLAYLGGK